MVTLKKLVFRGPGLSLAIVFGVLKRIVIRTIEVVGQVLPEDGWGCRVRGGGYMPFLRSCGKNFQVGLHAKLEHLGNISVGDDVYIGHGTWISGLKAGIVLDDQVMIGPYVTMVSNNHTFRRGSARFAKGRPKVIVIGRGTWIASGVTVTAGVTVGESCLLAAGAVVCKDVAAGTIVAGVPAVCIGTTASMENDD